MAVVTTPAILLRSHAYGETSRILRFFTAELGVVGVMARGIRTAGSQGKGAPETFAGGTLTVYVKETRELQTLKEFSTSRPRRGLGTSVLRLAAASVVGEVVLRHGGEAAAPVLFEALEQALDRLETTDDARVVQVLLARGWGMVSALGYHPVLEHCVECGRGLGDEEMGRFDFGAGGVRCPGCMAGVAGPRLGPGARRQVAGLLTGAEDAVTRPRAHLQLLSDFVTYHVSGSRPLESFRFLAAVLPAAPDAEAEAAEDAQAGAP